MPGSSQTWFELGYEISDYRTLGVHKEGLALVRLA